MQKLQSRLNIIFIAFIFSSLVYLLVGFALSKSGWKPVLTDGNLNQILFGIFIAASIALIVIALKIKSRLISQSGDQKAETVFRGSILLFALAEAPSIFGLVMFLLTGTFLFLAILCAVSLLAFVLVKPRA